MSLYLGRNKVGVTYKDANPYVIDNETLEELNDAVGYRVGDNETRNIPQIIQELNSDYYIARDMDLVAESFNGPWVRPQEWPDLDSLNLQMEGDDFIYMTYDNTVNNSAIAWHIEKATNGQNIMVTMGHISNGVYIVDETITGSNNNYVRWLTDNDPTYPIIRITGDIYKCYGYNLTQNGVTQNYRAQRMIERIAYVPHLYNFCPDYRYYSWGTFYLQREKIANGSGTALGTLYYAWSNCYNLQDLDISEFYTPNVTSFVAAFNRVIKIKELDLRHFNVSKVASFDSCFLNCYSLKKLNLSGWTTSSVTNLANIFSGCRSLSEIKGIENFITSKVTTLSSTFYNCRSLKELNLTRWNTEKLTTLYQTFTLCYSLKELDLSTWDISKVTHFGSTFGSCYSLKRIIMPLTNSGIITSLSSTFNGCYSLQKLDLSCFNITNKCTSIYRAFYNCNSLQKLDLTNWDISGLGTGDTCNSLFYNCYSLQEIKGVSNWHINSSTITGMFYNCYNLKEIDVDNWTFSNNTSLSTVFYNCTSIKKLNLSNWDISNCTTLSNMFYGCACLTSVGDISDWDTSKVTSLDSMFRYCYSLKEMPPIQNWDLSKVTSLSYIFNECTSLEEIIWDNVYAPNCTNLYQLFRSNYNLKKISTKNWTINSTITYSASYYPIYADCWNLQYVEGLIVPQNWAQISFANDDSLTHDAAINIFNALPQTTAGHTIHIPAIITNFLTAEEKAIATNKNWTIAA